MQLELRDNLPFIMVQVSYRNTTLAIPSVLVDTGSATSILSADQVAAIDIQPAAEDRLYTLRGTGGNEVVFAKQLETLQAGEKLVFDFDEKRHDK